MGGRVYAGGRVYTGAGRLRQADILVEGGIIRRIAPRIVGEGRRTRGLRGIDPRAGLYRFARPFARAGL